jgi:hypothetical protein
MSFGAHCSLSLKRPSQVHIKFGYIQKILTGWPWLLVNPYRSPSYFWRVFLLSAFFFILGCAPVEERGGISSAQAIRLGGVTVPTDLIIAVLRIHDILWWIRIRIRGSMPLTSGSGSGFGSGSWIRILLFSSVTFKMPAKN